ncbi:MAG: hypothetical protein ACYDBS_09690, partial [Acidimicrobiales bacterium]
MIVVTRTAICPVILSGVDYRRAHDAHHVAGGLWDQAVDWVHAKWDAGRSPGKWDIQSCLTAIPREERPLHAHSTEAIAHDLYEAIKTSRANRKNGMLVPLSMAEEELPAAVVLEGLRLAHAARGKLNLSLGRGRSGIVVALPTVIDSAAGESVPPNLWGEIQLCWDWDIREFSLHIPYVTAREVSTGEALTAIDE